jgi:hypothetical protein
MQHSTEAHDQKQLFRQKQSEEDKRERHMTSAHKRANQIHLLGLISQSESYRQACTPCARLREERRLRALIERSSRCSEIRPEFF